MGYAYTAWKWIVIPNITYNMKMLIYVYPFHYADEAFSIFHSNTMIRNDTSSIHELCNHDYPFNYILQVENLGSKTALIFSI